MSESRDVRIVGGTWTHGFLLWIIVLELFWVGYYLNKLATALQALAMVKG